MSLLIEYLVSGIAIGCTLALVGSGLVAVFRVTRVINFAAGTFSVVAAFLTASALQTWHLPHGLAEAMGVAVGLGLGLGVGAVALGRRGLSPISALVITFGLAIACYAGELLLWGDLPQSYPGVPGTLTVGKLFIQDQNLLIIGVTLAIFAGIWLFFNRTYLGKGMTACADNPMAAEMMGIDVRRMGLWAFGMGGLLGGIAGVLLAPIQPMTFSSDVNLAIGGFAAAVFGNLMSLDLALLGGIVLGVAESLVAGYFQASYESIVALAVMIAVMTWRAIQRRDQSDVEDRPPAPAAATGGARALWVRVALPLFGIAAALAIPLGLNQSNLTVYITMCLYAVITIGLSLLMGFAGQISAGQAAFMAIGAYTAALLSLHGWPPLLAFLAAPVVSGLFAALIGIPVLRMRANYLAFATMAIQLMLVALLSNIPALGGSTGLVSIPNFGIGSWQIQSLRGYAWLSVAVAVIILFLSRNLIASRPGRALRALATSEVAAESVGVHVMRFKVVVFAISAAYAGLAGAIYAFFMGAITPDGFSLLLSLEFLVMVIVGGLGTLAGPLVGTALLVILNQVLNTLGTQPGMPAYMPEVLSYAVYGCTLVVVLIAFPHGLVPFFSGQFRRWFGRQQQAPTAKPVPGAPVDVEPQRQSWG